jgi:hypothetical protein
MLFGACTSETNDRARTFVMVSADGLSVPAPLPNGLTCADTLVGGEYRIADGAWTLVERYKFRCASGLPLRDSTGGIVQIASDTLAFFGTRGADTLLWQRGVLRGDTLRVGATLFDGPEYVFVGRR